MSDLWVADGLVVDGTGSEPRRGGVLVEDGRVVRLGGERPPGTPVLDAGGRLVTPGLIDAHVHLGLSSPLGALMANQLSVAEIAADIFDNLSTTLDGGFTTVRDTGGIDGGVQHAVASGKVRGPRVLQCGPIQCQRGGHGHLAAPWEPTDLWCSHAVPGLYGLSLLCDSPDQMRANVRESFRRGADFIKLCVTGGVVSTHDRLSDTQLTREEIRVAVEEAAARGTYVTVHAHNNTGLRTAVEAGVRCVEHGSEIDDEVAALMAARGVAHVPTLAVVEALMRDTAATGLDPAIGARVGIAWQGQLDAVRASTAAGVLVGLGSDLIGPDQLGRGRELTLRAQLQDPLAALLSATRDNARVLGIAEEVGTLEPGKVADLVVWDSDPLADPQAWSDRASVGVVVQAGCVVHRHPPAG